MSDYEKLRQKRIEENKQKMKVLGINTMAYEVSQLRKSSKQPKKNKVQSKEVGKDLDDDYTPGEDSEQNHSSEEDENEIRKSSVNSLFQTKTYSDPVARFDFMVGWLWGCGLLLLTVLVLRCCLCLLWLFELLLLYYIVDVCWSARDS
ncbi:unnamed protein product [Amaranthus hypochondriacus]